VNDYSNNSYRGYATLEGAQAEYQTSFDNQEMVIPGMEQPLLLAHGAPEPVGVLAMPSAQATLKVRASKVKEFFILFLIVVIIMPI
jgi:hypothetical protein